jgi:hypothetical protein
MHPTRDARVADYPGEAKSKYEIWQVLGWPYETSVAMARIVFSGMFDRLPEMKIITHHLGSMIPLTSRAASDRCGISSGLAPLAAMKAKGRRPIEYFRLFFNDTAVGGARSAIRCGLDFFGEDRVLFATDCPFDPEGGPMFIRETIAALDGLALAEDERDLFPQCPTHAENGSPFMRLDWSRPSVGDQYGNLDTRSDFLSLPRAWRQAHHPKNWPMSQASMPRAGAMTRWPL